MRANHHGNWLHLQAAPRPFQVSRERVHFSAGFLLLIFSPTHFGYLSFVSFISLCKCYPFVRWGIPSYLTSPRHQLIILFRLTIGCLIRLDVYIGLFYCISGGRIKSCGPLFDDVGVVTKLANKLCEFFLVAVFMRILFLVTIHTYSKYLMLSVCT